ncbi:MAG: PilW family protein [Massilia sp.]|nr:PilW family protein [Massilia sp.]
MTRARRAAVQPSRGFSLIELMISLSIGLIIAGAAFAAYMGTASASRMADAQGRMNDDAQAALSILTQQLRMAGNNPAQANRVDNAQPTRASRHNPLYLPMPTYDDFTLLPATFSLSAFSLRGCDGQFSNLDSAARLDDLLCAAGAGPHAFAVSYEADRYNTVPTEAGLPTDCAGNALSVITATLPVMAGSGSASSAVQYAVADNRFYIASSAGIPSLMCTGNGAGQPQALVENIDDLRLSYGVVSTASSASTATVAGYLSANEIRTQPDLAALPDDAARWAKVITVRICVLVRSEAAVVADAASASYLRCDGTLESAAPDLRLRRAYSSTVVLRNRRL